MSNHDQFYSYAEIYDIAFDFKDISSECAFLRGLFKEHTGREPLSFLDLAAGPGLHAIEMAMHGLASVAVDLSQEMVEYGLSKATANQVSIDYIQADITSFTLSGRVDLAGIFMDSTSYLLDNAAVLSHLSSVARALNPGGLYVLEMSHPRDVFSVGKSALTNWEVERDGIWTSVSWGAPDDTFDPIRQLTQTTVTLRFKKGDLTNELIETAPQRCFTCNEFLALVAAEGSFDVIAMYGAMKATVPFSNEKAAWRMIPVLKKRVSVDG